MYVNSARSWVTVKGFTSVYRYQVITLTLSILFVILGYSGILDLETSSLSIAFSVIFFWVFIVVSMFPLDKR